MLNVQLYFYCEKYLGKQLLSQDSITRLSRALSSCDKATKGTDIMEKKIKISYNER